MNQDPGLEETRTARSEIGRGFEQGSRAKPDKEPAGDRGRDFFYAVELTYAARWCNGRTIKSDRALCKKNKEDVAEKGYSPFASARTQPGGSGSSLPFRWTFFSLAQRYPHMGPYSVMYVSGIE